MTVDDFKGGTFTISNGGVWILDVNPILNPPQVGILGMHTIQERPVNVNGKVEIRPMMYLALSMITELSMAHLLDSWFM